MADETKTLAWRLMVNVVGVEKNTRDAANSLSKLEAAAGKVQAGLGKMGIAFGVAAVAKLALEAIKVADAYTEMANSLLNSTDSAEELNAIQAELIQQAADTSSTVEQTIGSFNKLHDATEGLGLSQKQIIDLGKELSDIMRLSGMNAEEAQAGIAQFGDVLEDGTMNLKEFKAAFKQSPELIKALQSGLGKTRAELRLMAEQGDLTVQMLLDGLARAAPEVAAKVGAMAPTVKSATASAGSSFASMIGEFNEGIGVTEKLAETIQGLGDMFAGWAKNAQLMGLAVKFAFGTVSFEVIAFVQQTVENINRLAIEIYQSFNTVLGLGFDTIFTKTLNEWEQQSKNSMATILDDRQRALAGLQADIDAQVAKTFGKNLNDKGEKDDAAKTTADQAKAMESFAQALDKVKAKATEAANEMEALRVEMTGGKSAADAFRSQAAAAAASVELQAQMKEKLTAAKLPFGEEEIAKINKETQAQAAQTLAVKEATAAWALVQAAMQSTMTEVERADKETRELEEAYALLSARLGTTAPQALAVERALAAIAERRRAAQTSLDDSLKSLSDQSKAAENDLKALNMEMQQGKSAADAFRAQLESAGMAADLEERFEKVFDKAGLAFGPEQRAAIRQYTDEFVKQEHAVDDVANAWDVYNRAMDSTLTDAERATRQIDELNQAMILLDQKGLLTDEMIDRMDMAMEKIAESGNVVAETWQQATETVLGNFVDFLADGEFNIRRFVESTLKQIARLIIQMQVMSAFEGLFGGGGSVRTGGGGGGGWSTIEVAKGGTFSHGRLIPMAAGGVVSGPTVFPMASGTGLMGEAGPEAVMPLARMSSGKLGVNAQPANIQVVNNTGVQARARIERSENRTSIILEAAELGAQIAEDRMTRSMRSGYGATSTALQGTYALRRRA